MRPLRLGVLLIGTIVGHALHAQTIGAVRGKVVDENGRAVENAQVELSPGSRRAITLDDGRFAITNIRAGVYVLSVHRIGYEPARMSVGVRDSTATITVWLVAIPTQLDSIRIVEKSLGIRYSAVVLDQNDVPVVGAEVVAMGINDKLKTDSLGRFTVPKLGRGTLMLRIRKIGYAAYFDSFRMLAERADTIRMPRLATTLSPVEINERGGFGMDEWAYRDLDQRMRWKGALSGAISREELAQQGAENLCDAMPGTASGNRYVFISQRDCHHKSYRVLIDGVTCQQRKLDDFTADQIETIEYFPQPRSRYSPPSPNDSDYTGGSLRARGCTPEVYVIWLRHDAQTEPKARAAAELPKAGGGTTGQPPLTPAVDTAGQRTVLPIVEVRAAAPLLNPSYLQGQVVDSAGHPLRSALVYTEDPLYAALTDKKGFFRLAALPAGPIMVRAEHSGFVPIEVQLRLPPDSTVGIGLKLLAAATPRGTVRIDSDAGVQGRLVRVVSESGQPVVFANVTLEGATRITDEKGEVNLGVGKAQQFTVRVSRIGFAPWFGKVDFPAVALVTVTLPQIAQLLAPVTVNGQAQIRTPLQLTGFYDRWMMRQRGALSAVFIGPEELEFRHPDKIGAMLRGLNGVQLRGGGKDDDLVAYSTTATNVTGLCPMAVLIDGHQEPAPAYINRVLDANAVMAIEVYDRGGNMPISLQADDNACGVVAFWTGSRR